MWRIVLSILVISIVGVSCTSRENPVEKEDIGLFADGVIATVTTEFQDEGCEVLLRLDDNEGRALLMPTELNEEYRVHGLKLLITYKTTRIMQSDCQIGRPVTINKIRLVE